MSSSNQAPISVAVSVGPQFEEQLLSALKAANGRALRMKDVATALGVSSNTAKNIVDVCETKGSVRTKKWGSIREVYLPEHYPGDDPPAEKRGRGR